MVDGAPQKALLTSIGINWRSWTDSFPLKSEGSMGGGLFWLDPKQANSSMGAEGFINPVIAQLTLKASCLVNKESFWDSSECYGSDYCERHSCHQDVLAIVSAQGHHRVHKAGWKETGFAWRRCQFTPLLSDCRADLERFCDPSSKSRIYLQPKVVSKLLTTTPPEGGWKNVKTCALNSVQH